MDNFTIWVDAPSEALIETPLDDESSCYLRDEILQTQQYVFEKLDEQKLSEMEKEEHVVEEKVQAQKFLSLIATEGKRTKDIARELVNSRESVKSIELQLISIKNDFPTSVKLPSDEHEKILYEANDKISMLQESIANREKIIKKLLASGTNDRKETAKKECKMLRSSISEAKQQHDKLLALKSSCRKLEVEYEKVVARHKIGEETLESAKNEQKSDAVLLAQMTEETVTLRSQIMELEAKQSKNQNDTAQKDLENLQSSAISIQREAEELSSMLSKVKKESDDAEKQLEENKMEALENEKLIKERKKQIVVLLRKKLSEAKKKLKNGNEQKKITELRKALNKEQAVLDKAKKEQNSLTVNQKSLSELRREVSSMSSEIRSYDKQIREASKENGKLVEQINRVRGASIESTPPNAVLNDTAELNPEFPESDYSEMPPPPPPLQISPIRRPISQDAITGVPLMTSTPMQKPRRTRAETAAARRLDDNAASKTAEIKKKRGGRK